MIANSEKNKQLEIIKN